MTLAIGIQPQGLLSAGALELGVVDLTVNHGNILMSGQRPVFAGLFLGCPVFTHNEYSWDI